MEHPKSMISDSASKKLSTAGWNPERAIDISRFQEGLARYGYRPPYRSTMPTFLTAFLREFGGLDISFSVNDREYRVLLDPVEASNTLPYDEEDSSLNRIIEEEYWPIGELHRMLRGGVYNIEVLVMGASGKVYSESHENTYLLAQTGHEAINNLLEDPEHFEKNLFHT
jgi:hypothetical protein